MSGRARALVAVVGIVVIGTGVALATPVPVLALTDGTREIVAPLAEGEALTYSYRQSIYDVPVYEEFVRHGDAIDLLRVRSPDVRSVEYFRWDGDPRQEQDGLWSMDAPPSAHQQLVIRIAPLGQQRMTTPGWSYALLSLFGENVVNVSVARRPLAQMLIEQVR